MKRHLTVRKKTITTTLTTEEHLRKKEEEEESSKIKIALKESTVERRLDTIKTAEKQREMKKSSEKKDQDTQKEKFTVMKRNENKINMQRAEQAEQKLRMGEKKEITGKKKSNDKGNDANKANTLPFWFFFFFWTGQSHLVKKGEDMNPQPQKMFRHRGHWSWITKWHPTLLSSNG
ncbi:hypothetical protein ElyMa_005571600 [Elysia marginata]|uniref:Uncharacterized protein n=1 Tax=Elysia marginata TaxID=1093978 RepID=A0AAV4F1R6_9GAST|nr:hypothetical protein ElyMa_005571600 [Elysia marginata]